MPIFNVLNFKRIVTLATGEADKTLDLSGLEQNFLLSLLTNIPWTEKYDTHAIWADKDALTDGEKGAALALIDGAINKLVRREDEVKIAIVYDQKTDGTVGGNFATGAWVQRDLNQSLDPDGLITVIANSITLLRSGKYFIKASCPAAIGVAYHQARLTLNGVQVAWGTSEYVASTTTQTHSFVSWVGTLVAGDVLKLEHRCSTAITNGLGMGQSSLGGSPEIYSVVEITQYS
jgi:hypothetical protein